jgi:hypothetical protein
VNQNYDRPLSFVLPVAEPPTVLFSFSVSSENRLHHVANLHATVIFREY